MPLHYAADGGHTDAINLLIELGANKSALENWEEPPCTWLHKEAEQMP